MKKILTVAVFSILFSGISYAEESNTKVDSPVVPNVNTDTKSSIDTTVLPSKETTVEIDESSKQPVDNKVEAHSPISFLQGQLQLTPEQIEQTKLIFKKHYNSAKKEFSEILTPEQKARLEYLEGQNVQQTISM